MDNYFTSFCLFIHLGVNNIGATDVLNKNAHWVQILLSDKCTIIGNKQLQKERGYYEDCTSSKKAV